MKRGLLIICVMLLCISFASAITCPAGTRQEFAGGSCIPIVGESGKASGTGTTSSTTSSSAATTTTTTTTPSTIQQVSSSILTASLPTNTPTQAEIDAAHAEAIRLEGLEQAATDKYNKAEGDYASLLGIDEQDMFWKEEEIFQDHLNSEDPDSLTSMWSDAKDDIDQDNDDCLNANPLTSDYCWSLNTRTRGDTPEYISCDKKLTDWNDACYSKYYLVFYQLDQWLAKASIDATNAKIADLEIRIAGRKNNPTSKGKENEEQNQPEHPSKQANVPPFQSIVNFDNHFQPINMQLSDPQIEMLNGLPPARIHDLFHAAATNAIQNNPNLQNLANANLQNSPLANRLTGENPDAKSKLQKSASLTPPSLGNFINQEVNKLFNT